jgi:hypothetical protein
MDIHESDWQVFRRLHSIALERFCKRVLEEVREAAECKTDYHDCYREVYRLIRDYDKRMAAAFDDQTLFYCWPMSLAKDCCQRKN